MTALSCVVCSQALKLRALQAPSSQHVGRYALNNTKASHETEKGGS